ncbi:hypothetical protein Bca4012_082316 [Brassica carinata]
MRLSSTFYKNPSFLILAPTTRGLREISPGWWRRGGGRVVDLCYGGSCGRWVGGCCDYAA